MTEKIFQITELPEEAKPAEWTQLAASRLEDELRLHRHIHCSHYSKCLDHASGKHWNGWSCHWCSLNKSAAAPTISKRLPKEAWKECEICKGEGKILSEVIWEGRKKSVYCSCSTCNGKGEIE